MAAPSPPEGSFRSNVYGRSTSDVLCKTNDALLLLIRKISGGLLLGLWLVCQPRVLSMEKKVGYGDVDYFWHTAVSTLSPNSVSPHHLDKQRRSLHGAKQLSRSDLYSVDL
jgi:hypothetical protein